MQNKWLFYLNDCSNKYIITGEVKLPNNAVCVCASFFKFKIQIKNCMEEWTFLRISLSLTHHPD